MLLTIPAGSEALKVGGDVVGTSDALSYCNIANC